MKEIDTLSSDFSNIDDIMTDVNHVVRKFYRMFISGDYGYEYYEQYRDQWLKCTTDKKKRSFVIQSFMHYNLVDYDITWPRLQRFIIHKFGDRLEDFNKLLVAEVSELYEELGYTA